MAGYDTTSPRRTCPLCKRIVADDVFRAHLLAQHSRDEHLALIHAAEIVRTASDAPGAAATPAVSSPAPAQSPTLPCVAAPGALPENPVAHPAHTQAQAPPAHAAPRPEFVRCPECGAAVTARRLERHQAKKHCKPTFDQRRMPARGIHRTCGECMREMDEATYAMHICRPRGSSVFTIRGGAPGLGRRH